MKPRIALFLLFLLLICWMDDQKWGTVFWNFGLVAQIILNTAIHMERLAEVFARLRLRLQGQTRPRLGSGGQVTQRPGWGQGLGPVVVSKTGGPTDFGLIGQGPVHHVRVQAQGSNVGPRPGRVKHWHFTLLKISSSMTSGSKMGSFGSKVSYVGVWPPEADHHCRWGWRWKACG